jgi:hypothetical protein
MTLRSFYNMVVTIALMMVLAACSSSDSDDGATTTAAPTTTVAPTVAAPTTTVAPTVAAPTTTVAPTVAAPTNEDAILDSAVAAVMAAIDAKNSYDLDGWLMAHEGGKRPGVPLFAEQILMNAKQQYEIVEACQVTGEDSSGKTSVECVIKDNNGFWAVGGISDTNNQVYLVNADGLITNTSHFGSSSRNAFNQAFHQWLSDTYPEVYNEMGYATISSNGPGFDTRNPDHMLIAVEYVEEFVAQSDTYPLDPSDG